MKKLLIAMQFYHGDRTDAMRVARLMADVEKERREDVEFCFAARFDTQHDPATVQYVQSKFPVRIFTSTRKGTGWPDGCNDLWHELMGWAYLMVREGHADWEAVMTVESDSCPLSRDWISRLMAEWDQQKKRDAELVACGCVIKNGDPSYTHVNGNALFAYDILMRVNGFWGTPHAKSWDVYHAPKYIKRCFDTPLIKSIHNVEKLYPVTWRVLYAPRMNQVEPVFFHGAKSPKAEEIVRAKLNL